MEFWVQILYVVSWLILLKFLQVSVYPVLRSPLGKLAYPVSFSGGILAFSALSWYLGLLRLPVSLAAVPFLGFLGWALVRDRYSWEDLKPHLTWDLVFLIAFAAMLAVRLVNPTIISAEKFMDHAFIASIMRSPVVPPADPWYAGGTMNIYYYGGYWLMGILGTLTGVPSSVVFNLALPTALALAAVNLYGIGDLLLPRFKWFPLLTLVLVNPAFLRFLILGNGTAGILWDSTRVITNTINEYTLFSFLWGDAHPHVLAIFNQLFLLLVLIIALRCWYTMGRSGRITLIAVAALSLGSMPVMNTWDVLVYAPMTLLFGALILRDGLRKEKRDLSALGFLLVVPPSSILLYLPYYLQMATTGYLGIFPVTTPSDPWEFLLVHGFFLAIFIAYGARNLIKRPYLLLPAVLVAAAGYASAAIAIAAGTALVARWERRPEILMALVGISIITFAEIFYLKDYLGGIYYRMNTVFKFYNIAWILMGASSLIIVAEVLRRVRIPRVPAGQGRAAVAITLVILLVAAPGVLAVASGSGVLTLDGLQYLENTHPGDSAALPFVRGLPPGTVIAEGAKGDYSYPSRISSFTGVQTIIGWPGHEFMWRGAGGRTSDRIEDVRAAYEDPERSPGILRQYNATYVYVGDTERDLYSRLNLPAGDLVPVYDAQGVTIYRFTGRGTSGEAEKSE
jgi:YYY domain-containing protein